MIDLIIKNLEKRKKIIDIISKEEFVSKKLFFASQIVKTLSKNKKIIFCGNGGSAAQSCHMSAELSGRFKKDRKSQKSIVLGSNFSSITSISNDYSFDKVFSRELDGIGEKGDMIICYSTSGDSNNIVEVLKTARQKKIKSILFTGKNIGVAQKYSDNVYNVPSENTATIQEIHLIVGHIILDMVDSKL